MEKAKISIPIFDTNSLSKYFFIVDYKIMVIPYGGLGGRGALILQKLFYQKVELMRVVVLCADCKNPIFPKIDPKLRWRHLWQILATH